VQRFLAFFFHLSSCLAGTGIGNWQPAGIRWVAAFQSQGGRQVAKPTGQSL